MSLLPPEPWDTVHMDFSGPFPTDIVHSISASAIIPRMNRIFSTHGIPLIVRSNNGTPLTNDEIKRYMEENGIMHCRATPLWSQANSEVENFVKHIRQRLLIQHMQRERYENSISTSSFLITKQLRIALLDLLQHNSCSTGRFKTNFHNLLITTQ